MTGCSGSSCRWRWSVCEANLGVLSGVNLKWLEGVAAGDGVVDCHPCRVSAGASLGLRYDLFYSSVPTWVALWESDVGDCSVPSVGGAVVCEASLGVCGVITEVTLVKRSRVVSCDDWVAFSKASVGLDAVGDDLGAKVAPLSSFSNLYAMRLEKVSKERLFVGRPDCALEWRVVASLFCA